MSYTSIALAFLLCSTTATASAESWVCTDINGQVRVSKESQQFEECRIATAHEIAEAAKKASASRKIKPFCTTQKGADCDSVGDDTETGTMDGAAFTVYRDSASVAVSSTEVSGDQSQQNWDVSCSRDKMSGRKTCSVARGALWVFFGTGSAIVSVGDEHFPGSTTSIKVGQRRFDTSHRDGNFGSSPQIIESLKDGQLVVTRYMKWPYRNWIDDEFKANGFQVSAKLARWLLKNGEY